MELFSHDNLIRNPGSTMKLCLKEMFRLIPEDSQLTKEEIGKKIGTLLGMDTSLIQGLIEKCTKELCDAKLIRNCPFEKFGRIPKENLPSTSTDNVNVGISTGETTEPANASFLLIHTFDVEELKNNILQVARYWNPLKLDCMIEMMRMKFHIKDVEENNDKIRCATAVLLAEGRLERVKDDFNYVTK